MRIYKIYDNGGKTVDRYFIIEQQGDEMGLSVSDNPTHYMGFSWFGGYKEGKHLGKEIDFKKLPKNVQEHIIKRLEEV